jgi:MFS family permease
LTKNVLGAKNFADWGWRIPFLVSILLVVVSIYIRMKMHESPVFSKLKAEGKVSTNPLKESFQKKANFKMVLVALFGATMGQGVVWYTGQFYAQSFLENTCKLDFNESRYILLWAIVFATPFFVIFGSWSDKVGRKWIMLTGMLLGVVCYRPIYQYFLDATNVKEMQKTMLLNESEPVVERELVPGKADSLITTTVTKTLTNGMTFKESKVEVITEDVLAEVPAVQTVIKDVTLSNGSYIMIIALVFFQVLLVTMVYGPIAAFLVELFPTKIRYTSMSLPYHIGNGVFGGLVPFIATLIASFQGSTPLSGLWYPIGIAALSFVIGAVYIDNRRDEHVMD